MKSMLKYIGTATLLVVLTAALMVGCTSPTGPDDGAPGGATGGTVTITITGIPGDYQDGIAIVIVVEAGSTPEDLETDTVAYGGGGEDGANISTAGMAGPFALFGFDDKAWLSTQGKSYDVYLVVLTGEAEIDAAWLFHGGEGESVAPLGTFAGGSNLTLTIDVSDASVLDVTDMYSFGDGGDENVLVFGGTEYELTFSEYYDEGSIVDQRVWFVGFSTDSFPHGVELYFTFTGETLPAGTYTFDDWAESPPPTGTFGGDLGSVIWIGETEYDVTGGTVIVSIDGSIYTFDGTLTTSGGPATFIYAGPVNEVLPL